MALQNMFLEKSMRVSVNSYVLFWFLSFFTPPVGENRARSFAHQSHARLNTEPGIAVLGLHGRLGPTLSCRLMREELYS